MSSLQSGKINGLYKRRIYAIIRLRRFAVVLKWLTSIAGVAQLVEQLICNQPVASSSLVTSLFSEVHPRAGTKLGTNPH